MAEAEADEKARYKQVIDLLGGGGGQINQLCSAMAWQMEQTQWKEERKEWQEYEDNKKKERELAEQRGEAHIGRKGTKSEIGAGKGAGDD